MQRIVLSVLFIITVKFASAQYNDDPSTEPEEFKVIKMPKFPIADFPKNSIKVAAIRLIQLVSDSVNLGYVLKGLDNHVVHIKPAKPLTAFLQEQITRMYNNNYKEGGVNILWVLKELRIGEKVGQYMQYAYTKFGADAYVAAPGDKYKLLTSVDTVLVKECSGDPTAWHGEDIQDAFKFFLKQTLKAVAAEQSTQEMSMEQISAAGKQQVNAAILTAKEYNEGAYANFREFLNNTPSVLLYQPVTIEKRKVKLIQMNDNNQVDTLAVWGICKNGELYKYEEGYLIPIEKQGNGFIISNYIKLAGRRNHSSLGVMFGLVGVIGDELIKASQQKKQTEKLMLIKSIPYIKSENKQPEASCIDMKTGELSF